MSLTLSSRIYLYFVLILLIGCTHTNQINTRDDRQIKILEDNSKKRSARLTVAGNRMEIDSLVFGKDSVAYFKEGASKGHQIPIDSIENFTYRNHIAGAFEGSARTGIILGISGAILGGISEYFDDDDDYFELTDNVPDAMAIGGITSLLAGVAVGFPLGLMIGNIYKYVPPGDSAKSKKQKGER